MQKSHITTAPQRTLLSDQEENAFEDDEEEDIQDSPRVPLAPKQKKEDDASIRYSSNFTPAEPSSALIGSTVEPTRQLIDYFKTPRPAPLPLNRCSNQSGVARRPGEAAIDQVSLPKKNSAAKELGPLPLDFSLPNQQIAGYSGDERIIYVGPRPITSLQLHEKYANQGPDSYTFQPPPDYSSEPLDLLMRNSDAGQLQNNNFNPQGEPYRLFSGNNPQTPSELQFDSDFESGNLDLVIRMPVSRRDPLPTYDLFMRPDSNARRPTQQWFCFRVSNTKKGQTVHFNIVNFAKKDSLFAQGMKVTLFSQKRNQKFRAGWFKGATNIKYGPSKISRAGSPTFRSPRDPRSAPAPTKLVSSAHLNADLDFDTLRPPPPAQTDLYRETQAPEKFTAPASRRLPSPPLKLSSGDMKLQQKQNEEPSGIGATGVLYCGQKARINGPDDLGLLAKVGPSQGRRRNYFQLSFQYTFEYENDTVYFAYAIPYTFSMVSQQIARVLKETENAGAVSGKLKQGKVFLKTPFSIPETVPLKASQIPKPKILKLEHICTSLSGIQLPMLTITEFPHQSNNNSGDQTSVQDKPVVFVAGRIHPSESHASWVVHGFIETALSQSKLGQELRKRFILKVIPMCNVDGVISGNNRTSLIGKDLNRRYEAPNSKMHPVNYHVKKIVAKHRPLAFFDVHSHSRRKCTFIYGPRFPLHSLFYLGVRAFPKLMAQESSAFRYYSCKFKNERKKQGCARLSMWRDCGVNLSYTLETSFLGYLDNDRNTVEFSIPNMLRLGRDLARSLLEYALIRERTLRAREAMRKKTSPSNSPNSRKSPQPKVSHKFASSSELTRVHYSQMQRDYSPSQHSGSSPRTINNLTLDSKPDKASEWLSFLKGGNDASFVQESSGKAQQIFRVPSIPLGMGAQGQDSDLERLEDALDQQEQQFTGQKKKKLKTMNQLLENVVYDAQRLKAYKVRKDRGQEGDESEQFDDQELQSSSDENQDRGSDDQDQDEQDFQNMLKQAIEQSEARRDPSIYENDNNNRAQMVPPQFYPPMQLPSQIYLQMDDATPARDYRSLARWQPSRPRAKTESEEALPSRVRSKTQKRPHIHVRNLFEECFDDRSVIETKNRWPVKNKPKMYKGATAAAISKASMRRPLQRPQTQYQRFHQTAQRMPSFQQSSNELASKAAAKRINSVLQSSDLPQTLSSYFTDMLARSNAGGSYSLYHNQPLMSDYRAIPSQNWMPPRDGSFESVRKEASSRSGPYINNRQYRVGSGYPLRSSGLMSSKENPRSNASRKESGRISDISAVIVEQPFLPASSSKQDIRLPFSFTGPKASPANTIYSHTKRGDHGSQVSIRLEQTPLRGAGAVGGMFQTTQHGIAFVPSQSSTSFRGRLTPSLLNRIHPDRDMTPQPPHGKPREPGRIVEDSQRRKKSYHGIQQRVLIPSVAQRLQKKREKPRPF